MPATYCRAASATAGELASAAGLTGWERGEAVRGVRKCFESWLQQRGTIGDVENVAMLRQVRRFLEVSGEGRFTWWHRAADDRAPKTLQRAGVRRMVDAGGHPIKTDSQHQAIYGDTMSAADGERVEVEFFILPEVFRDEVCAGFDYRAVCRLLLQHGCLRRAGEGLTDRQRLPGIGLTRCYRVTSGVLDSAL